VAAQGPRKGGKNEGDFAKLVRRGTTEAWAIERAWKSGVPKKNITEAEKERAYELGGEGFPRWKPSLVTPFGI